jgi:hypothetical protein
MKNPSPYAQEKIDLIKRMLEEEIPNGTVCDVREWREWMKYEVVCGANKSFLCVSAEFLAISDDAEISKRFEHVGVAKAILKNPKGRFILTRDGLQQRSCEDI